MAGPQVTVSAPTPLQRSLSEVLGDTLMKSVSSSDVDLQELLDIFWKSSSDWNIRPKVFAALMLSAAGIHIPSSQDQLDLSVADNLPSEEADNVEMNPRAFDPDFMARYSQFICRLFKMVPLEETGVLFLRNVVKMIRQMIVNPWDSVRMMGACTGLKLLTFCTNFSNNMQLESQETSSPSTSASYVKKQLASLKWTLVNEVFKKAVRDVFVPIRTLVFGEMINWARHDPRFLLDEGFQNALCFGLHDMRIYALRAIEILFKEDLQDPRQVALFVKIQDALVSHLSSDPPAFPIIAMSTLASAVSFIKKTPSHQDVIFLSVFNKHQAVALDAARYLFTVHHMEKDTSDPVTVLRKLLIFFMEARPSMKSLNREISEDMLMDAFHPILTKFVTWDHWQQMLSSSDGVHTVTVGKMFYSYARKAITNYCSHGRVRIPDSPKKNDLLIAANAFTAFVAKTWRALYGMDAFRLNEEAMGVLTRSLTLLNGSLPSDVAFEIIKYLLVKAETSSNESLLTSIWLAVSRLYKVVQWDSPTVLRLNLMFDSVKNGVVKEFDEVIRHSSLLMGNDMDKSKMRLLFVIKFIEPYSDFNALWERCFEELNLQTANTNMDVAKVGIILQVLHSIVIRQFRAVTASCETSFDDSSSQATDEPAPGNFETSSLTSQLISRGQCLQKRAVDFLKNCRALEMMSFDILVDMVVCFGKHMAGHSTCIMISDTVRPDVESILVEGARCAVRRIDCKEMRELRNDESACCHVLKYTCELFAVGMIDISKIGLLLSLTGVNQEHDLMVMSAVKDFSERHRGKHLRVASALVTSLCDVISEVFSSAGGNDNSDSLWQSAVGKMKEKHAYWETMVDYQAVLRIASIRNAALIMMVRIAKRADVDLLLSTTSDFFSAENCRTNLDVESVGEESMAAPESDFSLAFAERSMIPHSTPHPPAALTETTESESGQD